MFLTTLLTEPVLFLRIVIVIIISVCLHELAHGWAALSQGDDTPKQSGHMTMNPVVHMGWQSIILLCLAGIAWGQMPVNPDKFRFPRFSNILVSAAGPLMNLALCLLAVFLLKVLAGPISVGVVSYKFLNIVARTNIILFLFNLLPIPPLDGFHVVSEIFPSLKPLNNSPLGLMMMMIVFINPAVGNGLSAIATLILAQLMG